MRYELNKTGAVKIYPALFFAVVLLSSCARAPVVEDTGPDTSADELYMAAGETIASVRQSLAEAEGIKDCRVEPTSVEWILIDGGCVNGLAEGEGTAVSADHKRVYVGRFREGRFNGRGIYDWGDGTRYVGQWKDGLRDGKGTFWYFEDGQFYLRYEGDFSKSKFSGYGTCTWADGDVYTGQWKDDAMDGKGTYVFADGRRYEGQFRQSKMQGEGVFTWPNGDRYEGELFNNKFHGHGTIFFADGRSYEGGWKEDLEDGRGVFTWPDGERYEGEVKDGMIHGKGIYIFADGRTYKGNWKQGRFNGTGTYTWPDGDTYIANWENGTSTKGRLTRADGTVIEGGWEEIIAIKYSTGQGAEKGAYSVVSGR